MKLTKKEIEAIIEDEIIVDAYDDYEVRAGWVCYMEDNLVFPFWADYTIKKAQGKSALERVKVVEAEIDEQTINNIYVEVEYNEMLIPVPLDELKNIEADKETQQAIQVWEHRGEYL